MNIFDPNAPSESLKALQSELEQLKGVLSANVQFPPNCFLDMRGVFSSYESRSSLSVLFPVLRESLNPVGVMQGGYLCAAFDNAFGPLSYLAARHPCTTLDLHVQFIRSVQLDDILRVSARVVSRGMNTMLIAGEIESEGRKLIATASANVSIMRGARGGD
ncbi:MAG TPA: PaaI family thioesterase [Bacteroidota bacterium]|nr:PaaI family thioesterase [Bacteroidota bacterium]